MNEYEVQITFRGQVLPVRITADDYFHALHLADEVQIEVIDLNDPSEAREAA